jgi:hypothetical protein
MPPPDIPGMLRGDTGQEKINRCCVHSLHDMPRLPLLLCLLVAYLPAFCVFYKMWGRDTMRLCSFICGLNDRGRGTSRYSVLTIHFQSPLGLICDDSWKPTCPGSRLLKSYNSVAFDISRDLGLYLAGRRSGSDHSPVLDPRARGMEGRGRQEYL